MNEWENAFDIRVALKIIKHISNGMYRTPGGILKELINNSYDAGATEVYVNSGYPSFSAISIKDNGSGMTKEDLEFSFMHIGASVKVLEESYPTSFGRKTIGMFGIGMLAAVHASQNITMRTFPKGKDYGLEAEFNLSPYFKYVNQIKTLEEFKFGTIKYKEIARGSNDIGTEVILKDIKRDSDFYKAISRRSVKYLDLVDWPQSDKIEDNGKIMKVFVKLLDSIGVRNIEDLTGRDQFLWELGLICPVEYLEDGPIQSSYLNGESKKIIGEIKGELESLNFKVYFDGVQLRRPIYLPSTKIRTSEIDQLDSETNQDFRVFPIIVNTEASATEGKVRVKAIGYVLLQPHRVTPIQLMGLYPRVKFVGVGKYDNNFFRVIHGEQPILRAQLSGELYIKEGLDDAVNLDREGFIEIDSGYQALKEKLRDIISESDNSVIKEAKRAGRSRRERRLGVQYGINKAVIEADIVKIVNSLNPKKKVELKEMSDLKAKSDTRDYSAVKVRSTKDIIELSISDYDIADSRTISLIVGVDEMLSSRPEYKNLRDEFVKLVNGLFKR